jgi:peptide/nickel transport system substrate-binding protein
MKISKFFTRKKNLLICMENMKKIMVVAIVIILLCVGFSGCINQAGEDTQKKRELLTIGVAEGPRGFFPWIDSYDTTTIGINFNIFNSLVEFDNSFRLLPKLAKSWNNPDNCTWRFFLRSDVKFQNGYNFTAYDVKYTLDLIKDNKSNVLRDLITEIKEVSIVDNYTVDIITYQPFPILLNKLTGIPIASQRYLEETREKWPIGTGAYKLQEYVPDDHITLERFDDYRMGSPVIQKVIFKIIQDPEALKNALISRDIDIMEHVPPSDVGELSNTSGLSIKRVSSPTVWYLGFDFRENSPSFPGEKNPLTDLRVRKALYQAIDINEILKLHASSAEPASQFLSPLIFGFNPEIQRLPYDLNASRQLLQEAGYENGFNLTLDCPEGWPTQLKISNEIVRQLSQVLSVKLNLLPTDEYYNQLYMGNCSIYLLGWIPATGDGGEIFDYLLRSEHDPLGRGSYNFGYYSNATVDHITEEVAHTMNQKTRRDLMRDGFRVAMDDVACIPLYVSVCNIGVADYIAWNPRSDLMTLVEEISVK